jgi:hypothetical protein
LKHSRVEIANETHAAECSVDSRAKWKADFWNFVRNFSPVTLMGLMHSSSCTDSSTKQKRTERRSASSRIAKIDHTEEADTWESAIVLLVEDTE